MKKQPQTPEFDLDLGDGKDELNLAEFPLSLISNRASDEDKVLVFKDQLWDQKNRKMIERKVTISGSADCGLPTAADEEVLLALIQITNQQGFRSKKVHFSRYQLLQILGWEDTGYYYKRVLSALNTWLGVNVKWNNAWRDYVDGAGWGSKGIVLIQDFELKRKENKNSSSYITWADQLFDSFRAGNLKGLDFLIYRTLRNNIAKRMFRFLDKRMYLKKMVVMDFETFAREKVGMKRSYTLASIKQQFWPAIEELEAIGFLKPLPREQRYRKVRAGQYDIVFVRGIEESGQRSLGLEIDVLPSIENDLVKRGISRGRAKSFARRFPEEHIRAKIEEFDFLMAREEGDPLRPTSPKGYLAQSIDENYDAPKGYKTKEELASARLEKEALSEERREKREAKMKAAAEKTEQEEKKYADETSKIEAYLKPLSQEQRVEIEEMALESSIWRGKNPGDLIRESVIRSYILEILEADS